MPEQHSQHGDTQTEQRPQVAFDAKFLEQVTGNGEHPSPMGLGLGMTNQVVQAYFDQVEYSVRQSRRIADLWAQQLILWQTTSEITRVIAPQVTKQVIEALRANYPALRDYDKNNSR